MHLAHTLHQEVRRHLFEHLAMHSQAILAGHTDVQDQHNRLVVLHGLEGFRAIPAAGEELEIWFQAKELLQGIENERMIISNYKANWHSFAPGRPSGTVKMPPVPAGAGRQQSDARHSFAAHRVHMGFRKDTTL